MSKTAIITGIGGQDGSYLAKNLLEKDYRIIGVSRRSSVDNLFRLKTLDILDEIDIVSLDIQEHLAIQELIREIKPQEFYNLAAQNREDVSGYDLVVS